MTMNQKLESNQSQSWRKKLKLAFSNSFLFISICQEEMDQSEPVAETKPAEVVETKKEEEKPVDKSKPVATKPIPGTPW